MGPGSSPAAVPTSLSLLPRATAPPPISLSRDTHHRTDAQHSPCANSSLGPTASWSWPPDLQFVVMHIMHSEQPLAVVPSPRPPPLWGPFQEPGY